MQRALSKSSSILAGALLVVAGSAAAQQSLYRSVAPDGRVTYSDRPASEGAPEKNRSSSTRSTLPAAVAASSTTLPYELREPTGRYPVTLYSSPECGPCANARALLQGRGVPFSERTVSNNDDIVVLKSLSGESTLPFATVGAQHLRGFSEIEWSRTLDAAGYPKQSQLPANWRQAAATPLVQKAAPPAREPRNAAAAAPDPAPAAPLRSDSNPAGIRF